MVCLSSGMAFSSAERRPVRRGAVSIRAGGRHQNFSGRSTATSVKNRIIPESS